jgi:hypothetical protein
VTRVDNRASVAYAAASARSAWAIQWGYSGGHDAHKASKRRQYARLAYVMRVDDRGSIAYAAASVRPRPRLKNL